MLTFAIFFQVPLQGRMKSQVQQAKNENSRLYLFKPYKTTFFLNALFERRLLKNNPLFIKHPEIKSANAAKCYALPFFGLIR